MTKALRLVIPVIPGHRRVRSQARELQPRHQDDNFTYNCTHADGRETSLEKLNQAELGIGFVIRNFLVAESEGTRAGTSRSHIDMDITSALTISMSR